MLPKLSRLRPHRSKLSTSATRASNVVITCTSRPSRASPLHILPNLLNEKYLDVPELTRAILHTRKQKRAPATAPATVDRDDTADAEDGANENVVLFNGGSVGESYHMCLNAIEPDDVGVPNSYSQAIDRSNPYRDLWIEAMQDEIAAPGGGHRLPADFCAHSDHGRRR